MKLVKWVLAGMLLCGIGMAGQAADAPGKIKALLITGDDVSPAHNWQEFSKTVNEVLTESGKFDVKVVEDAKILDSKDELQKFDVILFTAYFKSLPTPTDAAKENLTNFVKSGKGFVVTHLASASFPKWEEFGKLCGRKWIMGTSGHGPRGDFESKIVDKEHPVTKGMKDFTTSDELYAKLQGDADIHVLVQADSDWSKKTEPLVFTLSYGQGRVYHWAYGHDRKAILTPPVKELLVRGCEWAATGKVAGK